MAGKCAASLRRSRRNRFGGIKEPQGISDPSLPGPALNVEWLALDY